MPDARGAGDPFAAPFMNVQVLQSKLPIADTFEADYLEQWKILPLEIAGDRLRVGVVGEAAAEVLEDLELSYGVPLEWIPVSPEELVESIRRTFAASESVVELIKDLDAELGPAAETGGDQFADARDLANQPPVIRFVNLLIREAHDARASDIHLESRREGLSARFRVDGVLTELPSPPKGLQAAVVLRERTAEKIITVEDPVEYHLEGVTQVPVNVKAGMTFAGALRSILRQDPDVLMVGEMRDGETAAIAIQAALTGHLVFSTLHTSDAASALSRLVDLKVEPYLIAATLEGVLAQRLVRRICPECRERYSPDPAAISLLALKPVGRLTLERGRGCSACRNTGYRGRTGIFELLVVTDDVRQQLLKVPNPSALRELAVAQGMVTLRRDGWSKVQAGITTVEEVLRVTDQ